MFTTLIVEDNRTFRQTLRNLLYSRFPWMCIEEAGEGKECLQRVSDCRPDLVFMDIKLPGENGLELTKKIKRVYPGIIVVILTSYDLPEYRQAAYEIGADHYVSKGSSTAEEILSLVESVISGGKQMQHPLKT
jgi:DNA-binding NarL/FixJ family response regulator